MILLAKKKEIVRPSQAEINTFIRHVRESEKVFACTNPESGKVLLVESGTWALESGIQLMESGIPIMIGIRNPSSTDKESGIHAVAGIRNPRHGIKNSTLSNEFSYMGRLNP